MVSETVDSLATPARQRAAVFCPTPFLTVTIEDVSGSPDIHIHAGGQGVWVGRMLRALGVRPVLCMPCGGETGRLLGPLLEAESLAVRAVEAAGQTAAYVHDRTGGERNVIATTEPPPLGRHEADQLYTAMLEAAARADVAVLCGPASEGVLPEDTYRRLPADLHALGTPIVADLSGAVLRDALSAGVDVLKVSHEELLADGWACDESTPQLVTAMERLHRAGAAAVVVSRAHEPALALIEGRLLSVHGPVLQRVDHRGAGDSMTAGLAAGVTRGVAWTQALRLGAAAGALNVTRHGLATGERAAVDALAERVEVASLDAGVRRGPR
ncbi:phosphofructokinase [Intrasporangium chromatireducens Q5-1]|uniref:Phosphofructokinase n=1 Tax=Intrasporangium chromatireducens Q5-1 TaxID=584657 RepID=W9GJQ1_9MICO|nr:PfkB family carbohydrate kinase [Intrasporangium chromatireducens]EWT06476.1 phosphofructokinase [Intrasporangium chromatireducens Q5-1]